MNKTTVSIALAAIIVLLIAVLAALATIAWRGIRIEHAGSVTLAGMTEDVRLRMVDPVTLEMPEPAHLVTTGADGDAIPVDLSLPACPACGGPMVPVRWNLWTGRIDWVCPACGETMTASPGG
jgi:hypothetical protein